MFHHSHVPTLEHPADHLVDFHIFTLAKWRLHPPPRPNNESDLHPRQTSYSSVSKYASGARATSSTLERPAHSSIQSEYSFLDNSKFTTTLLISPTGKKRANIFHMQSPSSDALQESVLGSFIIPILMLSKLEGICRKIHNFLNFISTTTKHLFKTWSKTVSKRKTFKD